MVVAVSKKVIKIDAPLYLDCNNNCFSACLAMAIHFNRINRKHLQWGGQISQDHKDPIWNEILTSLSDKSALGTESSFKKINGRYEKMRKNKGIPLRIREPKYKLKDASQLSIMLQNNHPPIVLYDLDLYLHNRRGTYFHSALVTGIDSSHIYAHDPRLQADFPFHLDKFKQAWAAKSYKYYLLLPLGTKIEEIVSQQLLDEYVNATEGGH